MDGYTGAVEEKGFVRDFLGKSLLEGMGEDVEEGIY